MEPSDTIDSATLLAETRRIWNHKAEFWDDQMGEGNAFTRELVGPSVERLLAVQPDEVVLDVGCGNGVISRRLARLGARVIATDFSERFLELAAARSADLGDRITYHLIDATDEEQLLSLGAGRFDAVVSTMAMMDMPVIEPLLRATRRLLAPGGRFVFSLQHPAFNSNAVGLCSETVVLPTGEDVTRFYIRVNNYLDVPAGRGVLDRIVEQVAEHLLEALGVREDGDPFGA